MVDRFSEPFVVAGAGIGGLCAAIALGLKGKRVLVLEQAREIRPIGYGIQLGPNAFRMFEHIGIANDVKAWCGFPEAGVMRDMFSGEEVGRMPFGHALETRYGHPYGVIHRGDLHEVLLAKCRSIPSIELRTAAKVTDFVQAGGHVTVTLESGQAIVATALIGADGVHSCVRARMHGSVEKPRSLGYTAYRAVVPTASVDADLFENNVVLWAGPGYHLMLYPLRKDTGYNVVAVFRSRRFAAGVPGAGSPEELREIFQEAHPKARRLMQLVDTEKSWDIGVMDPLHSWISGSVALLGDSAHTMLQAMAQGACQAIEDAVWLAECVELAEDDIPQAFRDYENARRLRAVRMQYQSRVYWEVYHAAGAYADLRREILRRTPAEAIESMAWAYDPIPLPTRAMACSAQSALST